MKLPRHSHEVLEHLESVLLLTPEKLSIPDRRLIRQCIDNMEYNLLLTVDECNRLFDIYHRY